VTAPNTAPARSATARFDAVLRERVLAHGGSDAARAAGAWLVEIGSGSVESVVFFGSRKSGAGFDASSAHDLFVITRDYRDFYAALRRTGRLRRPAWLLAQLNRWLPPSQLRLELGSGSAPVTAKCAVIDADAFRRDTGPARRDHFCLGRMCQPVEIVAALDAEAEALALAAITSAHRLAYRWVRPWLPGSFDVDELYRTLLRVSLAGEIRPESSRRAEALWAAQREHRSGVYPVLLRELADSGELEEVADGRYRCRRPAGAWERLRLRSYFQWSRVRATLRWGKHVVTFDDWLDYILRKAQRHTGRPIELTAAERRHPLLLLWPRLLRYLRDKESPR
jgi:hypothetical protein